MLALAKEVLHPIPGTDIQLGFTVAVANLVLGHHPAIYNRNRRRKGIVESEILSGKIHICTPYLVMSICLRIAISTSTTILLPAC